MTCSSSSDSSGSQKHEIVLHIQATLLFKKRKEQTSYTNILCPRVVTGKAALQDMRKSKEKLRADKGVKASNSK